MKFYVLKADQIDNIKNLESFQDHHVQMAKSQQVIFFKFDSKVYELINTDDFHEVERFIENNKIQDY